MYKQFLIVGDFTFNSEVLSEFDFLQVPSIKLLSNYQASYDNNIIDFDYLITDSKITKQLLSEDGYLLTNIYFETNIDNYFAVGKCIRSDKTIDEQLNTIIDYIKGNY